MTRYFFPRRFLAVSLLGLLTAGCHDIIQRGLDERQANEVQTVLLEHGFEARKTMVPGKRPTWSIDVPDEQAADAIRIMNKEQLPRPRPPDSLEVNGLIPTPNEERSRLMARLASEVAQTLETVDGVSTARVHVVLAPPPRPGQPPGPSKAAAYLRVRKAAVARVNELSPELRRLIAGSVENLAADDVALVVTEVENSVPRPSPSTSPVARLRTLLVVFGGLVSALAVAVIFLTLRLKHYRALAQRQSIPAPGTGPIGPPPLPRSLTAS